MPTVPLPSHRGTGSWPRLWSCSFSLVSLEFSRSQTLGPWTLSGPWGQCSQSLSIPFSLPLPNTETAMTRKGPFAFNFMPAPWIQSSLELGRREVGSEEPTEGAYRLTSWRNGSPSSTKLLCLSWEGLSSPHPRASPVWILFPKAVLATRCQEL